MTKQSLTQVIASHYGDFLTLLSLSSLPIRFHLPQCLCLYEEVLICGGYGNRNCYSYHLRKQQYKHICAYPEDVELEGHTVVQCLFPSDDHTSNITLLSFGGDALTNIPYHTMQMRYKSVWDENESTAHIN